MILFSKPIEAVYSINFLSKEERGTYRRDLSEFHTFLNGLGIFYSYDAVHSFEEAEHAIQKISSANKTGVLVNILGHGNEVGVGNREGLFIKWDELITSFQDANFDDNIILNTCLMCKGYGVFNFSALRPKPFFAALGTNTSTDAQTYFHTMSILRSCSHSDNINDAIRSQNATLRSSANDVSEFDLRIKAEGFEPEEREITEYSYVIS